jgi:putative colanic acid biosynthesis acetyltransferase WcaF
MGLVKGRQFRSDASFSLKNKFARTVWGLVYFLFVRFSPIFLKRWRIWIYRLFNKKISKEANIYPKAKVWAPWNLEMKAGACIANNVYIYNQDIVKVEARALISQGAYICTGSHDFNTKLFKLITRPIIIGEHAWIASEAFVGPGVQVGEGAVLAARGVALKDLEPWGVYMGNPASKIKNRKLKSEWN